ncbi:platelet factor 4-like isoform X2 [Neophocaena asiaeorientalis asiaeorientalis]|uniref:Multifunctional fusion protein n=1 Tax=Neophocaena asiaeorientalis asiaeorientalis TaxID=1706337 RepID=A0A341C565_NEOAA|nr:platelet factor 4-like isoform X2 [Neophocaena asiaeorientalis asiaeorientalis]
MSLAAGTRAPGPRPSPGLLLLLAVALAQADSEGGAGDLRCVCVKTTSAVHPRSISSLEVIGAGLHCPSPQLIATLKDGRKICLDPQNPLYKKIIKKLLKS